MSESSDKNVLFLFCEGDHDAAFIHLILKHALEAEEKKYAYGQYPQPLPGIFRKAQDQRFIGEALPEDEVFPYSNYIKDEWLIIVTKIGGCEGQHISKIKKVLSRFLDIKESGLMTSTVGTDDSGTINQLRYAFVFDADAKGVDGRIDEWKNTFNALEDDGTTSKIWSINPDISFHSDLCKVFHDKGVFVWGINQGKGTLEDVTYGILSDFQGFPVKKSLDFISDRANDAGWLFQERTAESEKIAQNARKLKMALTIAGQFHRPGKALGTIVQDSLISQGKKPNDKHDYLDNDKKQRFLNNETVNEFSTFINELLKD